MNSDSSYVFTTSITVLTVYAGYLLLGITRNFSLTSQKIIENLRLKFFILILYRRSNRNNRENHKVYKGKNPIQSIVLIFPNLSLNCSE